MEDRVLPGQGVEWSGDGCELFNIAPVVPGEAQKGANFRGVLGGLISLMAASREGFGRKPSSVTRCPR